MWFIELLVRKEQRIQDRGGEGVEQADPQLGFLGSSRTRIAFYNTLMLREVDPELSSLCSTVTTSKLWGVRKTVSVSPRGAVQAQPVGEFPETAHVKAVISSQPPPQLVTGKVVISFPGIWEKHQ